jgi:transcription factor SPN1
LDRRIDGVCPSSFLYNYLKIYRGLRFLISILRDFNTPTICILKHLLHILTLHSKTTMEDLPVSDASVPNSPMPEAGHDPGDPLAPEIEEEHINNPPAAFPEQDMEVTAENEVDNDDHDHDHDSDDLSDVDEAQFDDFDPDNLALEEREQIAIDDSNVALLGVHKRKRTEAEIEESRKKKKKEKKRDRPKKSKRRREGSETFSGGEEVNGKRSRKRKEDGEGRSRSKKVPEDIDESTLTPEERELYHILLLTKPILTQDRPP